jgi:ATP-binding cassette subfamily B protein
LIVEFVIYLNLLTFPVSAIGWVASMVQRAAASQKRLNEFLQTKPKISPETQAAAQVPQGEIAFNNISFTYPHTGIKAVENFSLVVNKGEKVLILGKTGSGKTTLAQLLLRFFDPDLGNITLAGKDIKDLPVRKLREQISYVPQDVFLFSDTIKSNISFGLNETAGYEEVKQAAHYASIDNEIQTLEKGYDTLVGERGVTLSGGQKQRVSIARAIIKEASIMLFDDCLSAVDTKTENNIINNLYNYLGNRTAIIVTHRIFTVFNFDKIVILDNGKITEQGTHRELLAKNGYYADLYNLQIQSRN